MAHDNVALLVPFLDCEMLDIKVAGTLGRAGGINHADDGLVIFMKDGRAGLGKAKLVEDSTHILGNFGGMDSSNEFGFSRAGGDARLDLGLVGNSSPASQRQKPVTDW